MSFLYRKIYHVPGLKWFLTASVLLLGGLLIGRMVISPGNIRLILFGASFILLTVIGTRSPRAVMLISLLYLSFMGFFRRALIPISGWNAFDPLVMLVPLSILILGAVWCYRILFLKEPLRHDSSLFKLVRLMLLIDLLQVFNPLQGGLMSGFGGIMFYVAPLAWMVLSREYFNERWIKATYCTVFVVGGVSALYGLKQTTYGFMPFEDLWVSITGYAALMVGDSVRAFSFFTSAAEYAQYLLIAIVIGWGWLLRGTWTLRIVSILVLPLLMYSLFMASSRTPVILGSIALSLMTILHVKGIGKKLFTLLIVITALTGLFYTVNKMETENNSLLAHQVNGLTNPLDEEHSTLGLHWTLFVEGLKKGFTNPIGSGLGSTTLAGAKFAKGGDNSEVDISNMMMSNGLIGGIIYLLLFIQVLRVAFRQAGQSLSLLIVLGILVGTLGSWMIGGNYSTVAIIWLSIGYLDKASRLENENDIETGASGP